MSSNSRQKSLIFQLIRAARGQTYFKTNNGAVEKQHLAREEGWPSIPSMKKAHHINHRSPLPCFALQQHNFGRIRAQVNVGASSGDIAPNVPSPSDFHAHLCERIRNAKDRIILASLYIGVGSKHPSTADTSETFGNTEERNNSSRAKEDEFLLALQEASSNPQLNTIQILLDANRAMRKVSLTDKSNSHSARFNENEASVTNSAEAVFSRISPFLNGKSEKCNKSGLFLFPVNDKRLCSVLPSPLDEVAGVFHIKAYIVDDELILSGANLSEEYFKNRLDRYTLFKNGGGGLVDFYAQLCSILCSYSTKYEGNSRNELDMSAFLSMQNENDKKLELESSLLQLFKGDPKTFEEPDNLNSPSPPVAYAIPTFQMPNAFLGRPLDLYSDKDATCNLITAAQYESQATIRLSSAYLNLTPSLLSALTLNESKTIRNVSGTPYILTAGAISHGFARKPCAENKKPVGILEKIKAAVPNAFLTLVRKTALHINAFGGKVFVYERPGWTFHAKGLWITDDIGLRQGQRPEQISNASSLVSSIIGSGNYGERSEDLDVESNCILIFDTKDCGANKIDCGGFGIKEAFSEEWNDMLNFTSEVSTSDATKDDLDFLPMIINLLRRYL